MKNYNYILIVLFSILLVSCEEYLEPEVFSRLSTSNFPKTKSDFDVYVSGIYGEFHKDNAWYRYSCDPFSRLMLGEFGTEECFMAWEWANYPQRTFTFLPHYDLFTQFYTYMVPAVTRATAAIEVLKNSELDDENLKKRYIAEVKSCRAMWMYDLEGFYGPPPVVLDPEAALNPQNIYFPPRLSEKEYLDFLEADLLAAIEDLPLTYSDADYGRFTKGAASTILLKLYMRHKEFQKAIDLSGKIMNMGYGLVSDFSKIWDVSNERNLESIFVLPASSGNILPNSNIWRAHVLPAGYASPTGSPVVAFSGYRLPWKIYDQFDPADKRLVTMVKDYYIMQNGKLTLVDGRKTGRIRDGALPLKYGEDPASDGLFNGNDYVLIRYADVLLLRAEALNEIKGPNQESVDLINQIRKRAFNNDPVKLASLSNFPDKQSLKDYLLQERFFEFCWEGERREDLIRHGKYIEFAQNRGVTNAQPHHIRYPLPSSAIIEGQGNIKQNDGY